MQKNNDLKLVETNQKTLDQFLNQLQLGGEFSPKMANSEAFFVCETQNGLVLANQILVNKEDVVDPNNTELKAVGSLTFVQAVQNNIIERHDWSSYSEENAAKFLKQYTL